MIDDLSIPITRRRDPPSSQWAGRRMTADDITQRSGDRAPEVLLAHRDAEQDHQQHRTGNTYPSVAFPHAQILLAGDDMAQRPILTSIAALEALKWYRKGHVVFHVGQFMFGRLLEGGELYNLIDRIPCRSVVVIDLDMAHPSHNSGLTRYSLHTNDRLMASLSLGLRQRQCRAIFHTTMEETVSSLIKNTATEAWRPQLLGGKNGAKPEPKWVISWEIWRNFPYRNLADGPFDRPPDYTSLVEGHSAAHAMLLGDNPL